MDFLQRHLRFQAEGSSFSTRPHTLHGSRSDATLASHAAPETEEIIRAEWLRECIGDHLGRVHVAKVNCAHFDVVADKVVTNPDMPGAVG